MRLRPYQLATLRAVAAWLRERTDDGVVALPTGSGKTIIFAALLADLVRLFGAKGLRFLVLVPRQELALQAEAKIRAAFDLIGLTQTVGVCCGSLGRHETDADVVIASPVTARNRLADLGAYNLVVVDEAHLLPTDDEAVARQVLATLRERNPRLRVLGFTATPWRLDGGLIYGADRLFPHLVHRVEIRDLIDAGYLAPVRTVAGAHGASVQTDDAQLVPIRNGEFANDAVQAIANDTERVRLAVGELLTRARDRRTVLVFACGVEHAHHVAAELIAQGEVAEVVTGETPREERAGILERFAVGTLRFVVNVECLTTGLDVPRIDCIGVLRPTLSTGLWCQMLGRGLRTASGKTDCLILDFAGNAHRHGPLDALDIREDRKVRRGTQAPTKTCPRCENIVGLAAGSCDNCGHQWSTERGVRHDVTPSDAPLWKADAVAMRVRDLQIRHREGRGDKLATVTLAWTVQGSDVFAWQSLCLDHWRHPDPRKRWAATAAARTWREVFGTSAPRSVAEALRMDLPALRRKALDRVCAVRARRDGRWLNVVGVELRTAQEASA